MTGGTNCLRKRRRIEHGRGRHVGLLDGGLGGGGRKNLNRGGRKSDQKTPYALAERGPKERGTKGSVRIYE